MLPSAVDGAAPPALIAAEALRIGGIVPFSTSDWPGKLVAVVFLQGCPWRCGYCHNPHLVPAHGDDRHDWRSTAAWLETRRGLLDGVVFSGGEPTAQSGLSAAVRSVRSSGFAVGLHTAGAYPRRLAQVVDEMDWIGFDIKAAKRSYGKVTRIAESGIVAFSSLRIVVDAGVPFELRTTVHPQLVDDDALLQLADELAALGIRRWILQPFRADGCADAELVAAVPRCHRIDASLLARLRERVADVVVRT